MAQTDREKTILWQLEEADDLLQRRSLDSSYSEVRIQRLPVEQLVFEAAQHLRADELVAFPTETVYGLGASAVSSKALLRVFAAKKRPLDNPLIAHVSSLTQLEQLTTHVPSLAQQLMDAFWPGPLSILLPARRDLPKELTAGLPTVAVRMPRHPLTLALIEEVGMPLAGPSANRSGRPSPTKAQHVLEDLAGEIAGVIDGGTCSVGIESTVIEIMDGRIVILRPGDITSADLKSFGVPVVYDQHLVEPQEEAAVPRSPGQKYRHYAPRGEMRVLIGETAACRKYVREAIGLAHNQGKRVAVLGFESSIGEGADFFLDLGNSSQTIAAHLYEALRACDEAAIDLVFVRGYEPSESHFALMNRLFKASGGAFIDLR